MLVVERTTKNWKMVYSGFQKCPGASKHLIPHQRKAWQRVRQRQNSDCHRCGMTPDDPNCIIENFSLPEYPKNMYGFNPSKNYSHLEMKKKSKKQKHNKKLPRKNVYVCKVKKNNKKVMLKILGTFW